MSTNKDIKRHLDFKQSVILCIGSEVGEPDFLKNHKNNRIQYLLDCLCDNKTTKHIPLWEDGKKDVSMSANFRKLGNYSFTAKEPSLEKSVEFYTKSIAYAPAKSSELSIGYANRSAVLYKAGLIIDCLSDIERAFDNDYPDRLKSKLYHRKAMCLHALNPKNKFEIKKSLTEAQKWINEMDPKDRDTMTTKLHVIQGKPPPHLETYSYWRCKPLQTKLKGENAFIPGLSNAIELKYNEEFGRHIVAARNIAPGETLATVKPYAKVVFLSMRYKVCWHCGQQTCVGLPCGDCVDVIYCSEACRQQEHLEHHDFECPIIRSMVAYQMEDGFFMSLRLVVKALKEADGSIETLKENLEKIDVATDPLTKGFTNNVLDPTKFSSIYGLVSNSENWMTFQTLILADCFLIAYFLATKTNFFGSKLSGDLSIFKNDKRFIFLVGLLEKNMCLNNTNSAEFAADYKGNRVNIFQMLVPALSFFNHSCHIMTIRSPHHDSTTVMTSILPIGKGEQVFDNYGTYYFEMGKQDRKMELRRKYYFTCNCEACRKNFPLRPLSSTGNKTFEYIRMVQLFQKICDKLIAVVDNPDKDYSLARTKQHSLIDVSEDIPRVAKIVEYFCKHFAINSEEVFRSVRCLEACYRLGELPYLSLDK